MYKRIRWFKIYVTKVPEGKTVSPYLAITREYSVFQGKMRKKIECRWEINKNNMCKRN